MVGTLKKTLKEHLKQAASAVCFHQSETSDSIHYKEVRSHPSGASGWSQKREDHHLTEVQSHTVQHFIFVHQGRCRSLNTSLKGEQDSLEQNIKGGHIGLRGTYWQKLKRILIIMFSSHYL